MKPLRVKATANYQFTLWFFVFFLLLIALYLLNMGSPVSLFFFFLANLFLIPLLRIGPLEMTDEYIRHRLPVGCFEIAWDEVQWIQLSPYDTFMVLHGEKKKLVIYGQSLWGGVETPAMQQLFKRQLEARDLLIVETEMAHWQISRGTRVSEF